MPLTAGTVMPRPRAREVAREMDAAGFNKVAICEYLNRHGIAVSYCTVRRWVNPKFDAAQKQRSNRIRRRGRRKAAAPRLVITRSHRVLSRMIQLDAVHVSATSIAAIITLDFHVECSAYEVRYALKNGRLPLHLAERAAAR